MYLVNFEASKCSNSVSSWRPDPCTPSTYIELALNLETPSRYAPGYECHVETGNKMKPYYDGPTNGSPILIADTMNFIYITFKS